MSTIGNKLYDEKKGKKKCFDWDCLNSRDIFSLCKHDLLEEADTIRRGKNVPDSLKFDRDTDSAFFFGKTSIGEYVGKKDCMDGHISVTGGSGSCKTLNNARTTVFT